MVKNLIIKSSYSMLPDGSLKSNWGDLLRSTVLLECIEGPFLWLTDARGKGLLRWFMEPENIITMGDETGALFDSMPVKILNADNYVPDRELFMKLTGSWHGFIPDSRGGVAPQNPMVAATEPYRGGAGPISYQQALVEGLGFKWDEQDYAPCRIEHETVSDVGLNNNVHAEWISKMWPAENWERSADALGKFCSVAWQQGLDDLDEYIRWMAACRLIVTQDTLGLHLASALRKRVVAIVGPTESREFSYARIVSLKPESRDCMPCNEPSCRMGSSCLSEVAVEEVLNAVKGMLSGKGSGNPTTTLHTR